MDEVEIKFEREDREGIVPVGIYLIDAAKRFGIRFEDACGTETGKHECSVVIKSGAELLSDLTTVEKEYFAEHGRKSNERLTCQARIEKGGEVVVMTNKKAKESAPEVEATDDKSEEYRKEFAAMPLEKKIAHLVQLETIALGETVSFIINSPFKIGEKVMDVMAEFGFKKEERQREAARPEEHKKSSTNGDSNGEDKKADSKGSA